MKFTKILIIFLAIFLSNCGYKIVNKEANYKILEINTTGDKRINYFLKNKLLLKSGENSKNLIKLEINTNKIKSIKEKNISNKVTKYEINISSRIKYTILANNKVEEFLVTKKGFYDVATNHSNTLNNEKNLINILTDNISENIIDNLKTSSDDF